MDKIYKIAFFAQKFFLFSAKTTILRLEYHYTCFSGSKKLAEVTPVQNKLQIRDSSNFGKTGQIRDFSAKVC